jgi:ligand-binding SRPBCC domain-containing protein
MPIIVLRTAVNAPPSRCFDLARDVDLHQRSTATSRERAVGGVTSGLLGPGDEVTWEATHFGVRQRLTSRITEFDPPRRFTDEMVRGAFRRFRHEHQFLATDGGTEIVDRFDYTSPLGPLGWLADNLFLRRYMSRLLRDRNAYLKQVAEASDHGDRP